MSLDKDPEEILEAQGKHANPGHKGHQTPNSESVSQTCYTLNSSQIINEWDIKIRLKSRVLVCYFTQILSHTYHYSTNPLASSPVVHAGSNSSRRMASLRPHGQLMILTTDPLEKTLFYKHYNWCSGQQRTEQGPENRDSYDLLGSRSWL